MITCLVVSEGFLLRVGFEFMRVVFFVFVLWGGVGSRDVCVGGRFFFSFVLVVRFYVREYFS